MFVCASSYIHASTIILKIDCGYMTGKKKVTDPVTFTCHSHQDLLLSDKGVAYTMSCIHMSQSPGFQRWFVFSQSIGTTELSFKIFQ